MQRKNILNQTCLNRKIFRHIEAFQENFLNLTYKYILLDLIKNRYNITTLPYIYRNI